MMEKTLYYSSELFTCRKEEGIAVFNITGEVFQIGTKLDIKEKFFSLFAAAGQNPHIRAILMFNRPGTLSDEEYGRFLDQIYKNKDRVTRGLTFSREEMAINQFILALTRCDKMVIAGLQGFVATPFLGVALAYDFRFAAEDVVFTLSHTKLGVPPGGALGFFLPRYIGLGRAVDTVLSNRPIPVQEAFDMGLVNAVFSEENFEEECIRKAKELSNISSDVACAKELLYPYREKELEEYLDREYHIIYRAFQQSNY